VFAFLLGKKLMVSTAHSCSQHCTVIKKADFLQVHLGIPKKGVSACSDSFSYCSTEHI